LKEVKENVQQSAVDKYNVELLYTALRKTLIAEINGGFKRYITCFFTEESMLIPGREELLHQLFVTMKKHFENVRGAVHAYSQHSAQIDTATALFQANLAILEHMLFEAENRLGIKKVVEDLMRSNEIEQVRRAVASNRLTNLRSSLDDGDESFGAHRSMVDFRKSYLQVALVNTTENSLNTSMNQSHTRRGNSRKLVGLQNTLA